MTKRFAAISSAFMLAIAACAQMSTGITSLMHTPTAFTGRDGDFYVGAAFVNRQLVPEGLSQDGNRYHGARVALALDVFDRIEASYSFFIYKGFRYDTPDGIGYKYKDQMFSAKIRLLDESRWIPAIAIGSHDVLTTSSTGLNNYFANIYAVASKHLPLGSQDLAISIGYRHWWAKRNNRWQGIVGGFDYRPSFCPKLSLMAEWTGDMANIGAKYTLLNHIQLQASLLNGRYPSAGLALTGNLFAKNKKINNK